MPDSTLALLLQNTKVNAQSRYKGGKKMNKLITNGSVVTMNAEMENIEDGWIYIENDKIKNMGKGQPPEEYRAAYTINATGKAILPGIVNVHTHVTGSMYKTLTEDDPNGFYATAFAMERFISAEEAELLSLLGCIETVKFGTTCIHELDSFLESVAKSMKTIGLRGVLSCKVHDVDMGRLQYQDYSIVPGLGAKRLSENVQMIEAYNQLPNGRITCDFGPHATDTVTMETAREIASLSKKYNVGIHIHVAQKKQEVAQLAKQYGLTPVEFLVESGMAGEKTVAAHCIFISDEDVDLLKKTGTSVAHCPHMLMKRGGFPPAKEFYEKGVEVGLGTDWLYMNPWEAMRCAIMGARMQGYDEYHIYARKAMHMHTLGAAKILGLNDRIGSIEIGKQADILIMDTNRAHFHPIFDDLIASIVYYATGAEIEMVLIDGSIVVRDGRVVGVEEAEVIYDASKIAKGYYAKLLESRSEKKEGV